MRLRTTVSLCLVALGLLFAGPSGALAATGAGTAQPGYVLAADEDPNAAPLSPTPEQLEALGIDTPGDEGDDEGFFEKVGNFIGDNAAYFIIGAVLVLAILAGMFISRGRKRGAVTQTARGSAVPATGPGGRPLSKAEIRRQKRDAALRARQEERLRRRQRSSQRKQSRSGVLPPAGAAVDPVEAEKQAARDQSVAAGAVTRMGGRAVMAPPSPTQNAPVPGVNVPRPPHGSDRAAAAAAVAGAAGAGIAAHAAARPEEPVDPVEAEKRRKPPTEFYRPEDTEPPTRVAPEPDPYAGYEEPLPAGYDTQPPTAPEDTQPPTPQYDTQPPSAPEDTQPPAAPEPEPVEPVAGPEVQAAAVAPDGDQDLEPAVEEPAAPDPEDVSGMDPAGVNPAGDVPLQHMPPIQAAATPAPSVPPEQAAAEAEQRLRAKVAEIKAEQDRIREETDRRLQEAERIQRETEEFSAVPGPTPGLAAVEQKLQADRAERDQALAEAEKRLRLIEQRAEDAERRAAFAERLAQLKVEESEREQRLREVISGIDRAEQRAIEAERRAEAAERAAAAALEGGAPLSPEGVNPSEQHTRVLRPEDLQPEQPGEAGSAGVEPFAGAQPPGEAPAPPQQQPPRPSGDVLNLNTASFEELRAADLSVTQATRVLAYRERFGGYRSVADLERVPGFPPDLLESLRGRLTV